MRNNSQCAPLRTACNDCTMRKRCAITAGAIAQCATIAQLQLTVCARNDMHSNWHAPRTACTRKQHAQRTACTTTACTILNMHSYCMHSAQRLRFATSQSTFNTMSTGMPIPSVLLQAILRVDQCQHFRSNDVEWMLGRRSAVSFTDLKLTIQFRLQPLCRHSAIRAVYVQLFVDCRATYA